MKTSVSWCLAAVAFSACSDVKAPEGDVDAPILRNIEIVSTLVEAGDTIDLLAELEDAVGVERLVITAGPQSGGGAQCAGQRSSRLGKIERWACHIALPDTLSAVNWTITSVEAEDGSGNRVRVTPSTTPAIAIVAPAVVRVRIRSDAAVTLMRGDSFGFAAEAFDVRDRLIQRPLTFEWSSSEPLIASITSAARVRTDAQIGGAWIRASLGTVRDSVLVWVQPRPTDPNSFRITLTYADDVPQFWRVALDSAAQRWAEVIRAELPPYDFDAVSATALKSICGDISGELPMPIPSGVEHGVRIYVGVSRRFPVGTYVEAVGGPCLHRPMPRPTTAFGRITVNFDKFEIGIAPARLRYLAMHEMGHVLGLVGVVQGSQQVTPWWDLLRHIYTGRLGLEGYYRLSGNRVSALNYASGAHWLGFQDLMSMTSGEITLVSVGALMDLGYPAAWYGAGAY